MISFDEIGGEGAALFAELHRVSFGQDAGAVWTEKDFTQLCAVAGTSAFVISEGEEVRGFVLIRLLGTEAEILTLCLHPDHRRRGFATLLLDHTAAQVRVLGAKRIFLEVASDNKAAIGLYEKASFRLTGLRKNYYSLADGNRKDACLMVCDI